MNYIFGILIFIVLSECTFTANCQQVPGKVDRQVGLVDTSNSPVNNYSTIYYLQQKLANSRPVYDVPTTADDVPAWRHQAAIRLRQMLGIDESEPVPLAPRVGEMEQRNGYRLQHVVFSSELYVDVPGWILIPDHVSSLSPAPAVLCIHGGVPGAKDEVAGELSNPAAAKGYAIYKDDYAKQFAEQGFVSFVIDLRNCGERKEKTQPDLYGLSSPAKYNQSIASSLLFTGQTLFGLDLFDCIRALDYLETRPEVRKDAIGAVGFSLGGNLAAWLAALDRRVKVVGLEGQWSSWRRLLMRDIRSSDYKYGGKPIHLLTHITYQMIPGFLRDLDMNLSIALVAPTPMVISYESDIWQFKNIEEAKHDTEPIKFVYDAFQVPENLNIKYTSGGHYWRKEVIVPWFCKRLREVANKHEYINNDQK